MEGFIIRGEGGLISLSFEKVFGFPETTSYLGGYDLQASITIKSSCFEVKSTMYTSTGEIYLFFDQLKNCNERLDGTAKFASYEGDLEFLAAFDHATGHVSIKGFFTEHEFSNCLNFEFSSDQTFMTTTIKELQILFQKYGDVKGLSLNR
ncbi:hypothetical protein GM921_07605 [Pedobacter sp. LMG 31464]|uniref:Uncharacterized protein n=1 Tax=Pedobacter planticolens TaxID=2679964 RepID=A0A923DYX7_9SPHI|nr:hypothetical protein [Pedobacter planticolens]MBB2145343.1 hypothetical protein [Pedobacter planticolens]